MLDGGLPALQGISGDARAMNGLSEERSFHSCMPRLRGMIESTAAWTPADGGVGKSWAWCYGAPFDERKIVGGPPSSGESAGHSR